MRFYKDFPEAINELRRELKEMGIKVHTKSVQNLDISNNPDFETMELQNYQYLVTAPDWRDIPVKSAEWAEEDFKERVSGKELNPGIAWLFRKEYWQQFLRSGKFDYAYPQRMANPLFDVIDLLKKDINSRRAYLSIFDPLLDNPQKLDCRIPCSLGYWFYFRQGKLNITYLQRSSDFFEHFNYDIYMADRLKNFVAEQVGVVPGTFSHWIGSFHVFSKNVSEVF